MASVGALRLRLRRRLTLALGFSRMSTASIDSLARLLNYCEFFAKERLVASGEFLPFGAFINTTDKLEAVGALLRKGDDSANALTILYGAVQGLITQNRASAYAVACNVTIPTHFSPQFPDGIQVQIESPDYSRILYIPYKKLPWFWLRRFLVVLPTFVYAEPIAVESKQVMYSQQAGLSK